MIAVFLPGSGAGPVSAGVGPSVSGTSYPLIVNVADRISASLEA
jgi:hypothetical protein